MNTLFDQAQQLMGITFSDLARHAFDTYCSRLIETNKVMNLTAITEPEQVYIRHFIDSAAALTAADFAGKSVIDVGCGAGFPGLPMKITQSDISLTLLDSLNKRIAFLDELCNELGMDDVRCIHGRAEEEALKEDMREQFDFAVSRAVASLPMLCELCLPFVKVGGSFIAMKSSDYSEELTAAENAISLLGAHVEEIRKYSLPGDHGDRVLIIIKKAEQTPAGYPRRFAKIQKKPL